MNATAETETQLQQLSDPDFMATWAKARQRLVLGTGSKTEYERARAEYERRIGHES